MDIDSKAKAFSKTSISKLNEDANFLFSELSLKKSINALVLKYDGKIVSPDFVLKKDENIQELLEKIKSDSPRFVIFDKNGKLLFIYWKPESAKPMEAMKYNSVRGGVEKDLGNLKSVEAIDNKELELLLK